MKIDFQTLFKCIIAIVIAVAAVIIAQMWFNVFNGIVFWKIVATLAIIGLVASLLIAIKQDIAEEKKMRDDKYLS